MKDYYEVMEDVYNAKMDYDKEIMDRYNREYNRIRDKLVAIRDNNIELSADDIDTEYITARVILDLMAEKLDSVKDEISTDDYFDDNGTLATFELLAESFIDDETIDDIESINNLCYKD